MSVCLCVKYYRDTEGSGGTWGPAANRVARYIDITRPNLHFLRFNTKTAHAKMQVLNMQSFHTSEGKVKFMRVTRLGERELIKDLVHRQLVKSALRQHVQ